MKKYILLTLCIISTGWINAQNIKGKFISRSTDEGTITFIYPQKGYENKDLHSKLIYDITHSSATDSVTFNFTYLSKDPLPADSIIFYNEDIKYSVPTTMFYIDLKKENKWENRASAILTAEIFEKIRIQKTPCYIALYSKEEKNEPIRNYVFKISANDWKKNTDIINKIFQAIKYYR